MQSSAAGIAVIIIRPEAGSPDGQMRGAAGEAKGARHRGHHRLVSVRPNSDLDLAGEIDAVHGFEKAVHEMLARLLAVGDDIDSAILL